MAPITTIVHFDVPPENADRFLAFWQDSIREKVRQQPGLIDGVLHRATDADGPHQFVNVARWESAESLRAGLQTAVETMRQEGIDMSRVYADLGVSMEQHNYVEVVRYIGTSTDQDRTYRKAMVGE